jgi:hypothetical protein
MKYVKVLPIFFPFLSAQLKCFLVSIGLINHIPMVMTICWGKFCVEVCGLFIEKETFSIEIQE